MLKTWRPCVKHCCSKARCFHGTEKAEWFAQTSYFFGQVSSKDTVSTLRTYKAAMLHSSKKSSKVIFCRSWPFIKDFSELLHMNTIMLELVKLSTENDFCNDLAPLAVFSLPDYLQADHEFY